MSKNHRTARKGLTSARKGQISKISGASIEEEAQACHPNDCTDNRLRAYLSSMARPRDIESYQDHIEEANVRGRSLIERLAIGVENDDEPRLRLTAAQVADVLSFIRCSEPVDLEGWWKDTYDGPSWVCGYYAVLKALEASLRPIAKRNASAEVAARIDENSLQIIETIVL